MTKKEIYDKALAILSTRRQTAVVTEQQNREMVIRKIPEIAKLEYALSQTTIELSKLVLSKQTNISEIIPQIMQKNLEIQQKITALLIQNGFPADFLDTKYQCNRCADMGYVKGERCDCLRILIRQIIADEFNRTTSMSLCHFDDFSLSYYKDEEKEHMEQIYSFCQGYAQSFTPRSPSILMMGETGLGKTHLSLSIANMVIGKGYTVLYGTAQEFFVSIQNEHFGKKNGISTLETILDADLFILDDLGAEYESGFNTASFYNLLSSRLNAVKPTIINTNLMPKQLKTRYEERIASRLMTLYKCLKFTGTDIRQQKLAEQNK